MTRIQKATTSSILALAVGALAACGGMGYPSPEPRQPAPAPDYDERIVGEVVEVDTRREEVEIRTERGQNLFVLYQTGQTPVWYEGQRYQVANLEPGDYVEATVGTDRYGNYVAGEIQVRESRQDRYGDRSDPQPRDDDPDDRYDDPEDPADRTDRLAGYVERIDPRRGTFDLRIRRSEILIVEMPYRPDPEDRETFDDLREGDFVRIVAERTNGDRYQLVEFEE